MPNEKFSIIILLRKEKRIEEDAVAHGRVSYAHPWVSNAHPWARNRTDEGNAELLRRPPSAAITGKSSSSPRTNPWRSAFRESD